MLTWKITLDRFIYKIKSTPLFSALSISLLTLLLLIIFSPRLIEMMTYGIIVDQAKRVDSAVAKDLEILSRQTKELADGEILQPLLLKEDLINIISVLTEEQKNKDLYMTALVDNYGSVFARTPNTGFRGDNIFQTTVWGKEFVEKNFTKTIAPAKFNPLVMVAGYPLEAAGKSIGAIFTGKSLDSSYAQQLRNGHLSPRSHVVFYSQREGVVGNTFENIHTSDIVESYFNSFSDLTKSFREPKQIKINDEYYIVKNIVFNNTGSIPEGGAFLFYRNPHNSESIVFATFITMLFFMTGTLLYSESCPRKKNRHIFLTAICSLIIFSFSFLTAICQLGHNAIALDEASSANYNLAIKLSPDSDMIDISSQHQIEIQISSLGETVDTIVAILDYDPAKVNVMDIITAGSVCRQDLFVEKSIDNENGKLKIICGIPSPGFSDSRGIIARLMLQPLAAGDYKIHINEDSTILSHDGSSMDVLGETTDGFYVAINPKDISKADLKTALPIFSDTHPNSNRWYRRSNINLSWPKIDGYTYKYAINKDADYALDEGVVTEKNSISLEVDDDGTYYFHLIPRKDGKDGPASKYKVNIDSTPPDFTDISINKKTIKAGDVVRLDFLSEDGLSGMKKDYYMKIEEGLLLPVKAPFYMPFMAKGDYHITIRSFDKAGNFNDGHMKLKVN